MLDLQVLQDTRRGICEKCPHFRGSNTCGYIVDHTGRKGILTHQAGIGNPRSRCPDKDNRRWHFIPSYYSWYVSEMVQTTNYVLYRLTKDVSPHMKPLDMVNFLYSRIQRPMKRSELLKEVQQLYATANDYDYIRKLDYDIDYVSGQIGYFK